jgi:hypothetical protein
MYHQLKQVNLRLNIYVKKHLSPKAIKHLKTAALVIVLLTLIAFISSHGVGSKNAMSPHAKAGHSIFSILSVTAIAALTAFTMYLLYRRKIKAIQELPILRQEEKDEK